MDVLSLKKVISEDAIVLNLETTSNVESIQCLVEVLAKTRRIPAEYLLEAQLALMKREALSSTAIGNGVSIPHARLPFVKDVVGALGISKEGIDFRSVDGKPVHVVFLFLAPEHLSHLYLQMLALVSRLVKSPDFIESLRAASSLEEVRALLERAEDMVFPHFPKQEN